MKTTLIGFSLVSVLTLALAQDPIPLDQAQKVAAQLLGETALIKGLPLKLDLDPDKPFAMEAKEYAALVIPDKALSKETLGGIGKTVKPLGQLWLKKLTPAVQSKGTPADQLNLVDVTFKNNDYRLAFLLLGVQKGDGDALELVVYAKVKKPLLRLPLKESCTTQELPLQLDMRPGGEALGMVDIKVLGTYEATLPVAELEL